MKTHLPVWSLLFVTACANGASPSFQDANVGERDSAQRDTSTIDLGAADLGRADLGVIDLGLRDAAGDGGDAAARDAAVDMGVPGCSEPLTWLGDGNGNERFGRANMTWSAAPAVMPGFLPVPSSRAFSFNAVMGEWWDATVPAMTPGIQTAGFSVEAWFAPRSPAAELVGPTFKNGEVALFTHMSRWALYVLGTGLALGTTATSSTDGSSWSHVVGTWSAGMPPVLKLFVNGRELSGGEFTVMPHSDLTPPATMDLSGPMRVGGALPGGDRPFGGAIDDISLHCTALNAAAVRMRCMAGASAHRVTCATM